MRYAAIVILSFLLFSTSAISLQTAQIAKGSIEGIVMRSDSGEPVANAQVTLTLLNPIVAAMLAGADPAVIAAAQAGQLGQVIPAEIPPNTTDSDGSFSFKNLNAGTYRLIVVANGFARQEYGQRVLDNPQAAGTPIHLATEQVLKDLVIRLTPTGTISGRIIDDTGQPALGIPIELLRPYYNSMQGRLYRTVGSATANDRGEYRLFGIPPGRYYLAMGNRPGQLRGPLDGIPVPTAAAQSYALSFFPGVSDISQAVMVEVKSGQETSFDMAARRQSRYRVRGTIIDSRTGQPPSGNVSVTLFYRNLTGGSGNMSSGSNYDPATGKFELLNVTPGQYRVQAQIQERLTTPPPTDAASIQARIASQAARPLGQSPMIRVVDADVDGVTVTIMTGIPITGRVAVEGQALSALTNIEQIRVNLRVLMDGSVVAVGATPSAIVAADGTFQLAGVREGEFMVNVLQVPAGFYLKGVQYGGTDILNNPFKFSGNGSGTMDVTLRAGTARLSGIVTDARSQVIPGITTLVIPEQRSREDLYRTTSTDQNGRFTFANITPGQYRVFSLEAFEPGIQFDPDFVKRYEQQGRLIQVAESSDQNVDLRVIPAN